MPIHDHYSQRVPFTGFNMDNGDGSYYQPPDPPLGEYVWEVIDFNVFDAKSGDSYLKVLFFDAKNKEVYQQMTKLRPASGKSKGNFFLLESWAVPAIFGRSLSADEVQEIRFNDDGEPVCKTPAYIRKQARGAFVPVTVDSWNNYTNVQIKPDYDQLHSMPWRAPSGVSPMFDFDTHDPTGNWPTTAAELFYGDESGADNDDDF